MEILTDANGSTFFRVATKKAGKPGDEAKSYLQSERVVPFLQLGGVAPRIGVPTLQKLLVAVIHHPQLSSVRALVQHVTQEVDVGTDVTAAALDGRQARTCEFGSQGVNSFSPNDTIWCHHGHGLSISLWEFIWRV